MKNKNFSAQSRNRGWKLSVLILVALVLIGILVYLFFIKNPTATSGTIPATTSSTKAPAQTKSSTTTEMTSPGTQKSTTGAADSGAISLVNPPTGTFVSNHHPSLGGSTKPSGEQSTCNTTPGATCYIKFTSGDVVKTLPSQVANSDGAVIWNWDVAKAGFTVGSWKITAVAQAGDKTVSAVDNMNLEVQP